MVSQHSCRPQLVWIAVVLGLVARKGRQPSFGLRRDRRFLAGPRPIVECRKRPIDQGPLAAALDCLMMYPHWRIQRQRTTGSRDKRATFAPACLGPRSVRDRVIAVSFALSSPIATILASPSKKRNPPTNSSFHGRRLRAADRVWPVRGPPETCCASPIGAGEPGCSAIMKHKTQGNAWRAR